MLKNQCVTHVSEHLLPMYQVYTRMKMGEVPLGQAGAGTFLFSHRLTGVQ